MKNHRPLKIKTLWKLFDTSKIKEINERYKTPKITMTKGVKLALFLLRIYLVFLVLVLIIKFITLVRP